MFASITSQYWQGWIFLIWSIWIKMTWSLTNPFLYLKKTTSNYVYIRIVTNNVLRNEHSCNMSKGALFFNIISMGIKHFFPFLYCEYFIGQNSHQQHMNFSPSELFNPPSFGWNVGIFKESKKVRTNKSTWKNKIYCWKDYTDMSANIFVERNWLSFCDSLTLSS